MAFTVEIEGLDEIESEWKSTVSRIGAGTRKAVAAATRAGERTAEAHAPRRTGQLANKIQGRVISSDGSSATGELVSAAKYSSFVADGTRPHEIRPKRGKVLAFVAGGSVSIQSANVATRHSNGGTASYGMVFARVVHHPGTRPNDFFKFGELAAGLMLEAEMQKVVDDACASMNG